MHISISPLRKINNINMIINPLPGSEIGIPLFFLEKTFTNLHYGIDINSKELFFFQSLVGFFTYGTDRLLDSINNDSDKELSIYFRNNKEIMGLLLLLAYCTIIKDLFSVQETQIFVLPLTSTLFYKQFKEKLGELKAIYISSFWVLAAIIIPSVWYEGNYNIILDPLNYIPCFLSILGTSNLADIKDLEEDKEDGINTWPVILGKEKSAKISILILLLSTYLVAINENIYKFPIESSLFELQNIGSIIYASNISDT